MFAKTGVPSLYEVISYELSPVSPVLFESVNVFRYAEKAQIHVAHTIRKQVVLDLRDHPFMTSTRRGEGSDGPGSAGRIRMRKVLCFLLMLTSWCLLFQNFVFGWNKKWNFL